MSSPVTVRSRRTSKPVARQSPQDYESLPGMGRDDSMDGGATPETGRLSCLYRDLRITMSRAEPSQSAAASDPSEWLDRHCDALFRYALLRTRDAELAEEMVQECLLAALKARSAFAGKSSERTWLIGILKRKLIDHARRKERERSQGDNASQQTGEFIEAMVFDRRGFWKEAPARWGGDPRRQAQAREFRAVFDRCIETLPSPLAEAFLLREVDQLESKEICEVLDLSPTNLWTRLHRARLALRACLEKNWFGDR